MSPVSNKLSINVTSKTELEDFIFSFLKNVPSPISGDIIITLIRKFIEAPGSFNKLEELYPLISRVEEEENKIYCLIHSVNLFHNRKLEIKASIFNFIQSEKYPNTFDYLELFIDKLIETNQEFLKEIIWELVFVVRGSFKIEDQPILYKKLIPFLTWEQKETLIRGFKQQVNRIKGGDRYLALLSLLENIPPDLEECSKMAKEAFNLLEEMSYKLKNKIFDKHGKFNIPFEFKVKLLQYVSPILSTKLEQFLVDEIESIKDPFEQLLNLAVLDRQNQTKSKKLASYLNKKIEELAGQVLNLKLDEKQSFRLIFILGFNRFDLVLRLLRKITDVYTVHDVCQNLLELVDDEQQREEVKKIDLGAIKNMPTHKMLFLSHVCSYLSVETKIEFVNDILSNYEDSEVQNLLPDELAKILPNLSQDILEQLFRITEKITSDERRVGNLLTFIPYFGSRRKKIIKEGVMLISKYSEQQFLNTEQERIITLVIRHGL